MQTLNYDVLLCEIPSQLLHFGFLTLNNLLQAIYLTEVRLQISDASVLEFLEQITLLCDFMAQVQDVLIMDCFALGQLLVQFADRCLLMLDRFFIGVELPRRQGLLVHFAF